MGATEDLAHEVQPAAADVIQHYLDTENIDGQADHHIRAAFDLGAKWKHGAILRRLARELYPAPHDDENCIAGHDVPGQPCRIMPRHVYLALVDHPHVPTEIIGVWLEGAGGAGGEWAAREACENHLNDIGCPCGHGDRGAPGHDPVLHLDWTDDHAEHGDTRYWVRLVPTEEQTSA